MIRISLALAEAMVCRFGSKEDLNQGTKMNAMVFGGDTGARNGSGVGVQEGMIMVGMPAGMGSPMMGGCQASSGTDL